MIKTNTKQEGLTIAQIRAKLKDGDYELIGEASEYSSAYVRACITEKRRNTLIIKVAMALINNREAFVRDTREIVSAIKSSQK